MNELRIRREECPIQIHPVRSCECPRRGARTGRGQYRLDGVADVGTTGRGPDVGVLPGLGDGLGDRADLLRCGVAGVQYSADRGISGRRRSTPDRPADRAPTAGRMRTTSVWRGCAQRYPVPGFPRAGTTGERSRQPDLPGRPGFRCESTAGGRHSRHRRTPLRRGPLRRHRGWTVSPNPATDGRRVAATNRRPEDPAWRGSYRRGCRRGIHH